MGHRQIEPFVAHFYTNTYQPIQLVQVILKKQLDIYVNNDYILFVGIEENVMVNPGEFILVKVKLSEEDEPIHEELLFADLINSLNTSDWEMELVVAEATHDKDRKNTQLIKPTNKPLWGRYTQWEQLLGTVMYVGGR